MKTLLSRAALVAAAMALGLSGAAATSTMTATGTLTVKLVSQRLVHGWRLTYGYVCHSKPVHHRTKLYRYQRL